MLPDPDLGDKYVDLDLQLDALIYFLNNLNILIPYFFLRILDSSKNMSRNLSESSKKVFFLNKNETTAIYTFRYPHLIGTMNNTFQSKIHFLLSRPQFFYQHCNGSENKVHKEQGPFNLRACAPTVF